MANLVRRSLFLASARISFPVLLFGYLAFPESVNAVNDQIKAAPATLIQMEIVNGCILNNVQSGSVALGVLEFGEVYEVNFPYNAVTNSGNGNIRLRCTPGTTAKITMNAGLHGTGVYDRKMRLDGGSSTLLYQLYTSSTRQFIWDDINGVSIYFDNDVTKSIPIYGRIPAQVTPASGFYADQILVTVNY